MTYITKNYFANMSTLAVYWKNNSDGEVVKYLASSEILTVELCCVDCVNDGRKTKRSFVENTLILLNDGIPDERGLEMMKNCKS